MCATNDIIIRVLRFTLVLVPVTQSSKSPHKFNVIWLLHVLVNKYMVIFYKHQFQIILHIQTKEREEECHHTCREVKQCIYVYEKPLALTVCCHHRTGGWGFNPDNGKVCACACACACAKEMGDILWNQTVPPLPVTWKHEREQSILDNQQHPTTKSSMSLRMIMITNKI